MEINETVLYRMKANTGMEIAVCADVGNERIYIRYTIDFGHGGTDYEREGQYPLSANGVQQAIQRAAFVVTNWAASGVDDFSNILDASADGEEA